jgi:hypothetical protein
MASGNGDGPRRREVYDFVSLDPAAITVEVRAIRTFYEIEDLVEWATEQGELPTDCDAGIGVTVVAMALDANGKKLGPVPIDATDETGRAVVCASFTDLAEFGRDRLPGLLTDPATQEELRTGLRERRERGERV